MTASAQRSQEPAGWRICDGLPRERLIHTPTPLEAAPRLSRSLGIDLWIKREDLAGLCVGGNKARLMEFALGSLKAKGVDTLIAYAEAQSNKLRDIAAAAARCGLLAVLLIPHRRQESSGPPQGNRLLFDLLGAEVRGVEPDLDDSGILAAERAVHDELAAAGRRPSILDRRLDYGVDATIAYVDAAQELKGQLDESGLVADAIFVAAGAGMTAAGLALGLKRLGLPSRVTGVCVSRRAPDLMTDILLHAGRASERLGLATRLCEADVSLDDRHLGEGYGAMTPELAETVRRVARAHGMVLDPVYNAKAAQALIRQVESGQIAPDATVVLVNTGGAPAVHSYAAELSDQCPGDQAGRQRPGDMAAAPGAAAAGKGAW